RAADLLEAQMHTLMGLIVREAGKSLPNAIAEIREAVDFLRYYAAQIRGDLAHEDREREVPRADTDHGAERAVRVVRELAADLRR
ncbi:aldehyde dehydrogenase family protein, partial [Burkholderia cenocepacia]